MTARTFTDEEFAGTHVRFPIGWANRLLEVARAELAAQLRYIDDQEDPALVLEQWLAGKQTIPLPGPRSEPGDILVKQDRGEQWMLTARGWRELAPIELQAGAGEQTEEPVVVSYDVGKNIGVAFDERTGFGAGGACPRHGVYSGQVCPACKSEVVERVAELRERVEESAAHADQWVHRYTEAGGQRRTYEEAFDPRTIGEHAAAENVERPFESLGGESGVAFKRFRHVTAPRFYGKSVVEGYLDERDIERLWPPVKRVLDELLLHSETLDEIAKALTEGPDGGNADPLYTAAGQAVSFARALEYARRRLLTLATDELRR